MEEDSPLGRGIEKVKDMIIGEKSEDFDEEETGIKLKYPKHLALTLEGIVAWSKKNNVELKETYHKSFVILKNLMQIQVKHNITILSVLVLPASFNKEGEHFLVLIDALINFLQELKEDPIIHKNKMKVSVLGKWYDLPGRIVEPIKEITSETKDYDAFFLNLCINYNGQEEIIDAVRLIGRQIKAEKIDPELVTKEVVKENLYSSYFIPPDLYIKTGMKHKIPGLLLWDSLHAKIYFADKYWPDLKIADLKKALKEFQE